MSSDIATPIIDALMAKWDDDGATRGAAFIELRDVARGLERDVNRFNQPADLVMTEKGLLIGPYSAFRSQGWTDAQLIDHGYAECKLAGRYVDIDTYRRQIEKWCAEARKMGLIITVEQVSDYPPAMGKHHDVVTVREARK